VRANPPYALRDVAIAHTDPTVRWKNRRETGHDISFGVSLSAARGTGIAEAGPGVPLL
jgi:hypothetical protein